MYGLASTEWQGLTGIQYDEVALQARLEEMISAGRIDQSQAADIWDDLQTQGIQDIRSRRGAQLREEFMIFATGQHISPEDREAMEERIARQQKEEVDRLRTTGRRGITGVPEWQLKQFEQRVARGEMTEEQVGAYIERRFESQARARTRRKKAFAWQVSPPRPEFAEGFEEQRLQLGGTQPWRDWFEGRFAQELGQFRATIPKFERGLWEGLSPRDVEAKVEMAWAERLRKRVPELEEEFATRFPFGRGGIPSAFQPRIQTVGF